MSHFSGTKSVAPLIAAAFLTFLIAAGSPALAKVDTETIKMSDGTRVRYQVVVPDDYDGTTALPAILAFPGGGQDMDLVKGSVRGRWREGAEQRGYIVISPAAPGGKLYFRGGEAVFPEFLEAMKERYNIRDGKFHMAGISNGGISAFHVAAMNPDYFTSILVIPGFVRGTDGEKAAMYEAVKDMCIAFIAGEKDTRWVASARRDHATFTKMGLKPFLHVVSGEGHVPASYGGEGASKLYDLIDTKAGC